MNPIYGTTILVFLCSTLLASVAAAPSKDACAKGDINTDPFSCCTIPKLLDVAVVTTCFEKYPIDPATKPTKGSFSPTDCMSECIMNNTGIYNKKGDVDSKKLSNVFTDSLPANSPWLTVVNNAIKECSTQATKKTGEFDKTIAASKKTATKGQLVCNPEASFLVDCIHTTVFTNCPASLRSASTECDSIWQFLKTCPFSALRQ
ncbi:general odorant-binding protein 66-like [Anopheles ziemanni]|uniref:general odorant-binding protein 66-like n=1 Tax=Anopheles coustani TaxID=139045 RepID=UPI002659E193|nr:general odorant-binding protein 66-like [Anopheles coustani]XP_058167084.1 general odorant-binding protein 66-like [Anopheles ziemanni]